MPRRPRLATGGLAYRVLNRRVGRLSLFEKPADYFAFEKILKEAHEAVDRSEQKKTPDPLTYSARDAVMHFVDAMALRPKRFLVHGLRMPRTCRPERALGEFCRYGKRNEMVHNGSLHCPIGSCISNQVS